MSNYAVLYRYYNDIRDRMQNYGREDRPRQIYEQSMKGAYDEKERQKGKRYVGVSQV